MWVTQELSYNDIVVLIIWEAITAMLVALSRLGVYTTGKREEDCIRTFNVSEPFRLFFGFETYGVWFRNVML